MLAAAARRSAARERALHRRLGRARGRRSHRNGLQRRIKRGVARARFGIPLVTAAGREAAVHDSEQRLGRGRPALARGQAPRDALQGGGGGRVRHCALTHNRTIFNLHVL